MASILCSFSSSVFSCKNYHDRITQFNNFIKQPKYSSKAIRAHHVRRSANYSPSLYSFDYLQSLSNDHTGEDYKVRAESLKDAVKMMISKRRNDQLVILEMIDDLQRLGISYHFENEIKSALEMIDKTHFKSNEEWSRLDLKVKALGFRILRQHGYDVSQDIFHNFKNYHKAQNVTPRYLVDDMMEMLCLYEACFLSFEGESILDDARHFTTKYLKQNQDKIDDDESSSYISSLVSNALKLPLHLSPPRVYARWFIQLYDEKRSDHMNPTFLELAKLDFDMVQAIHLKEIKDQSRWWRDLKWDKKLPFARDRLVEHYLWAAGFGHLPQQSLGRRTITRVNCLISTIDDVYDVYGTLDELEQFTDIIDRWDINAIDDLPEYMKICSIGFHNTINEITYDTLTDKGFLTLQYLKKEWAKFCKSYLVEAQWYNSGYTPTLKEYVENGYISISTPIILSHSNFFTSVDSKDEIFQDMKRLEKVVYYAALIFRLADDLGTSTDELERGDNPKSIQCYMHESGATEDEARIYIKEMMIETWKKLNMERARTGNYSQFAHEFIDYATNMPRMAHFMYGAGDGHGRPEKIKSQMSSLFFDPICRDD